MNDFGIVGRVFRVIGVMILIPYAIAVLGTMFLLSCLVNGYEGAKMDFFGR